MGKKSVKQLREEWLNEIIKEARPLFKEAGNPLPTVRAAIGNTASKKTIAECWHSICSEDQGREIWVSPTLTEDMFICKCLMHELCHAALPDDTGHRKPFVDLCNKLLLTEGKPTIRTGGKEFEEYWKPILRKIGKYPGVGFKPGAIIGGRKKQGTYLKKVECGDCETVFRITQKFIDLAENGLVCPVCQSTNTGVDK